MEPLHFTIRFSNSYSDLNVDVDDPDSTTVLWLKHRLRASTSSRSRLRLIYRGRLLPDTSALSSIFQPHESPSNPEKPEPLGKGKARVDPPLLQRIYVNCSIGDELTTEELEAEASSAVNPPESKHGSQSAHKKPQTTTRPRPRGFDRLLQSGFTTGEIATLRTQFASIHNDRFAPDSLPSPDTMRGLEDAWIDTNAGEMPSTASRAFEDEGSSMATVLDILIQGMMIGFFFPMGSMTWLLREGDLWSEKWKIFVGGGVVLSLSVGVVIGLSGSP